MRRNTGGIIFIVLGLLLAVFVSIIPRRLIVRQRAEGQDCQITLDASSLSKLERNWEYYAQGGEETQMMIQPVLNQVAALKPKMIRIDHTLDFPSLGLRLLEIKRLGAIPFISLSYFPPSISSNVTVPPASWTDWEKLITQTAEEIFSYFGDETIYFEVWNEPDLFGGFDPETYFQLYRATINGISRCTNCQKYKVGGPAITTMKTDWMNRFLNLVVNNGSHLDFVSWHAYQRNPYKFVEERNKLVNLTSYKRLANKPEIIISEWGITPEVSYLNDGFESASHTVAVISLTTNLIDKMFAFELKDGLDQEGKQFWGRWGLLTHQDVSIRAKPRYYAFDWLNSLGKYQVLTISPANVYALATIDYPNVMTIVAAGGNSSCQQYSIKINSIVNSIYQSNLRLLESQSDPSAVRSNTITVSNQTTEINLFNNFPGVSMITLTRQTAGGFKGQGRTGIVSDYSTRVGQNTAPVDYPIFSNERLDEVGIGFWFKRTEETSGNTNTNWQILSSYNAQSNGFMFGIEKSIDGNKITLVRTIPGGREEHYSLKVGTNDFDSWHYYQIVFNNKMAILTLGFDNQILTTSYENSWPTELGNNITFGPGKVAKGPLAEGFLDDLVIRLNADINVVDNFDW